MRQVNALKIRNHLGEVLEQLRSDGEPVLISKARKLVAVLITPEQFERRFLDHLTEEKKKEALDRVRRMRANRTVSRDSVSILRGLRGYGA